MIPALLAPGLRRVTGDSTMADLHASSREKSQRQAEQRIRRAGYAKGGRIHSDVTEDESKERLKRGGKVEGAETAARLDRRARGGRTKGRGHLNIVIQNSNPAEKQQAAQQGLQQGVKVGAALGARQAAARMGGGGGPPVSPPGGAAGAGPGRLPIAPPPGAGAPPGVMPQRPPGGMMATGGTVRVKEHVRRKAGGKV
jgi:hypothetical protein